MTFHHLLRLLLLSSVTPSFLTGHLTIPTWQWILLLPEIGLIGPQVVVLITVISLETQILRPNSKGALRKLSLSAILSLEIFLTADVVLI